MEETRTSPPNLSDNDSSSSFMSNHSHNSSSSFHRSNSNSFPFSSSNISNNFSFSNFSKLRSIPLLLLTHNIRLQVPSNNPRSKSRPEGFAKTLQILKEECSPELLITFARAVSTPEQHINTVALRDATPEMADMRTVVLLGNSATRRVGRYVYTPRSAE